MKFLLIILTSVFIFSCSTHNMTNSESPCTHKIDFAIGYYQLGGLFDASYNDALLGHQYIFIDTSSDYGEFNYQLLRDSLDSIPLNYTFKTSKNIKHKVFKDYHTNYFKYAPYNADILARKLKETYQKYDSVFIGKHTWYNYKLNAENEPEIFIEKEINYDSIYPVCWSKAIRIAKKNGVKGKRPKLTAPENYPEQKQEKGQAFWLVSDERKSVKIDVYDGTVSK